MAGYVLGQQELGPRRGLWRDSGLPASPRASLLRTAAGRPAACGLARWESSTRGRASALEGGPGDQAGSPGASALLPTVARPCPPSPGPLPGSPGPRGGLGAGSTSPLLPRPWEGRGPGPLPQQLGVPSGPPEAHPHPSGGPPCARRLGPELEHDSMTPRRDPAGEGLRGPGQGPCGPPPGDPAPSPQPGLTLNPTPPFLQHRQASMRAMTANRPEKDTATTAREDDQDSSLSGVPPAGRALSAPAAPPSAPLPTGARGQPRPCLKPPAPQPWLLLRDPTTPEPAVPQPAARCRSGPTRGRGAGEATGACPPPHCGGS